MKFLVLISMSALLATTSAFAAPKQQSSSTVVINAKSLRNNFLSRNIDVARALNEVYQAKAQVAQSRANLLPAVNLGAVLTSGNSFMLQTVSVLLPFLMPSNWMDLRQNQSLLRAQGQAYYLSQLNGYASAYSLYATIVGDMQLRRTLKRQYDTFKAIEEELRPAAEAGIILKTDYLQIQAQAQMALVQLSQIDEVLKREKAAVRQMLGLSLSREIVFEESRVPSSGAETMSQRAVLDLVVERSPEVSQINSLIAAAKAAQFKAGFSFLSGASMSSSRDPMGGFSNLQGNGAVNLGFGYFPALEISNLNTQQLVLQRQGLQYEQAQLVESNLGAMKEAQIQYQAAADAEKNLNEVYNSEVMRYRAGMIAMSDLVQAGNTLTASSLAKVKAATSIDTIRINLHRMVLRDQFQNIGGCVPKSKGQTTPRRGLRGIFKPQQELVTLDQACRG